MINVTIYDDAGNEIIDRRLVVGRDYVVNYYVTGVANLPDSLAPTRLEVLESGYAVDSQANILGVDNFVVSFDTPGQYTIRASESSGLIIDSPSVRLIPISVGLSLENTPKPAAQSGQETGSILAGLIPNIVTPVAWGLAILVVGIGGFYAYKLLKK